MLSYLQKPPVQLLLFVTVVASAGGFFYMQDKRGAGSEEVAKAAAEPPPKNMGQAAAEVVPITRTDVKSSETTESVKIEKLVLPAPKPEPPTLVKEPPKKEEKPKTPAFPDLVQMTATARPKPFVPQPPKVFAPRGTLIKATLVITLESNAVGTPILALVNEDVYFQGNLIVPAGTQVQASAIANSKFRDRIDVRGAFTFIWADGSEYVINGIALDHQPLPDGTFAITDGSPGIHGRILRTDDYAEFKLLVAEAVKGLMNNSQTQYQSIFGLVPENTNRNAALGSGASAAGAYANILAGKIEKDLEYVQVPAGTSFYIYTLDVFEPDLRSIAGLRQGNKPTPGTELQEAAASAAAAKQQMSESEMQQRLERARAVEAAAEKSRKQEQEIERTRALFAPSPPAAPPRSPQP